ncbi:MAG: hypothetical protein ABI623_02720, partial [bacterium]
NMLGKELAAFQAIARDIGDDAAKPVRLSVESAGSGVRVRDVSVTVREGESIEVQLLGYGTTECFAGNRLDVYGELNDTTNDRYSILIVLDGEGTLVHAHGEIPLKRATQVFVPAAVGKYKFRTNKHLSVFKCLPAEIQ